MISEDFSNQLVIDDSNFERWCGDVVVNGDRKAKGLIPRDYDQHPQGCYRAAPPFNPSQMPLIPREQWSERIAWDIAHGSRLSDIRRRAMNGNPFPALDQNGEGYCWFYSGTACVMLSRAAANAPYVRLSGHSGASVIKNFRDQGGWGCAGLDFIAERGIATVEDWPEKSRERRYDNETTWRNAARFRVSESWMDMTSAAYDRTMSFEQFATCLLLKIPCICDFNWWGHSVAACDLVELDSRLSLMDPNRWGIRILNSWTNNWGDLGEGVLRGRKGMPDGGAGLRVSWGG